MAGASMFYYRNHSSSDTTTSSLYSTSSACPTISALGWSAPEGKEFKEWNTKNDGTGTPMQPGIVYATYDGDRYAIWVAASVPKIVNSTQLDGALTATANAILSKTGSSTPLEWDMNSGFADAIDAIELGGVTITDTLDSNGGTIREIDTFGETLMLQTKTNIVPTASSQTIVPDTGYVGLSSVQVVGDSNLVPENIKKDVTLFNVTGTCEGGGGGDLDEFLETNFTSSYTNSIVSVIGVGKFAYQSYLTGASFPSCEIIGRNAFLACGSLSIISFPICNTIDAYAFDGCSVLTNADFSSCSTIGSWAFAACPSLSIANFPSCKTMDVYAFKDCSVLTTISFPLCQNIGSHAFDGCRALVAIDFPTCGKLYSYAFVNCKSLTTINFPSCTYIYGSAFYGCESLITVSLPLCTKIWAYAFANCYALETISLPSCSYFYDSVFRSCYNLTSLYLFDSSVATLITSTVFYSTPIAGYTTSTGGVYGSIYVPSSLLASYKSATNWTYFSDRLVGV